MTDPLAAKLEERQKMTARWARGIGYAKWPNYGKKSRDPRIFYIQGDKSGYYLRGKSPKTGIA